MLHEREELYANDTSLARVKNFDFDNDMSENIFSHPYISYIVNERLQGEGPFHSKNPFGNAKMRLKNAPQKPNFIMAKAI